MEKRALLAIILSLMILLIYQEWMSRQYGPPPSAPEEEPASKQAPKKAPEPRIQPQPKPQQSPPPEPHRDQKIKEIRVETDHYVAVFTNQGARLKSFTLKHYRASVGEKSPPFEMISPPPGVPYPLGLQLDGPSSWNDGNLIYSVQGSDLRLTGNAKGTLAFEGHGPGGMRLLKQFTFTGSSYPIQLELSVEEADKNTSSGLVLSSDGQPKGTKKDAAFEGLLALVDGKMKRHGLDDVKKGIELSGQISWAGFGYTYFLFAVLPEAAPEEKLAAREAGPALLMDIRGAGQEAPGKKRYTLFVGPKELDLLTSMNRELERSIDHGYFAFISVPILYVMHFFHRFTGSYGIDIILLTILIKLLTAPLTHKSYVSMKQMQKLQPQMERIKEKFKDDRERLNKEITELYRRNKVNPLGGCLPMLFQFPVFIGLYNALLTPIELRHASFLWIKDLSRPDWESLPVALGGWDLGIPVLTILMGASMFIQQWMTPTAGDPNQKRMMLMMTAVFTVMFVTFPAGLTIYWLVNNILSIAQQYLINRMGR